MPKPELHRRIVTSVVIGGVIIGLILGGVVTAHILILTICAMSARELYKMLVDKQDVLHSWLFAAMLSIPVVLHYFYPIAPGTYGGSGVLWDWITAVAVPAILALYLLTNIRTGPELFFGRLKAAAIGFLIVTVPCLFAVQLIDLTPLFLLGLFMLQWTSDTGAYAIGSRFGRHKLAPRLSPGKTWEGTIGALVLTLIVAFLLSQWIDYFGWRDWLVNAVLVSVFGTLGDLQISAIKRVTQVKDTGTLLPGHGGFLDRFDSFLGCLTWVGIYNLLI